MRKLILAALAATVTATAGAQMITDTVSTSAGYAKQVWYSLPSDEQGNAPKTDWDLAFDASGFGSTVLINSVTGTMLWAYPKADTGGWNTIDTNGLSTWPARYNSDTSWSYGAMGRYANTSNPYDLDWGIYNVTTHAITGDSLYIIKLAAGDYKKLWIESLVGGTYTFKYANIDGTSPQSATLNKSVYSGKNFGYFYLQSDSALDREPAAANWDLLFTQYTAFIPQAYTVTGILSNKGIRIAKCAAVTGKDTFSNWAPQTFGHEINTIGYNWKTFASMTYIIQDSLVFFVARTNGEIWKVICRGFGGSVNGSYMFSKEKLFTPNSSPVLQAPLIGTALYPNPSNGMPVTLVYNLQSDVAFAKLSICDVGGKVVHTASLEQGGGLHQYAIPATTLIPGMYMVTVSTENSASQQKLIIN